MSRLRLCRPADLGLTSFILPGLLFQLSCTSDTAPDPANATRVSPANTQLVGPINPSIGLANTDRVSLVTGSRAQALGPSAASAISGDGWSVVFSSGATNLVAGDANGQAFDIFLRNRIRGLTRLYSVASDGTQANGSSLRPTISADGRVVAFSSIATNLVPGDTNSAADVFVVDPDVFVRDRATGLTERVSVASDSTEGNNQSGRPDLNADGQIVAFGSLASNLVPDDRNNRNDVFIRDRQAGETSRISVAADGTEANGDSLDLAISADGRFVAFESQATNLVPDDSNGVSDVFIHDRQTGDTQRISIAWNGHQSDGGSFDPSISEDGRLIAFQSRATNLVADDTNDLSDIFVHDRQIGGTFRVSVASGGGEADGDSFDPSFSGDGQFVAFESEATNLVPNDTNGNRDIFRHERGTGDTEIISVAADGIQADHDSFSPAMQSGGGVVTFHSGATNLVEDDTNRVSDVFVRILRWEPPQLAEQPEIGS